MFYEKRVKSLPALFRELEIMDLDSGCRIHAKYQGKRVFLFVTKSTNRFAMTIYSLKRHGKVDLPDKQISIKELDFDEAKKLITEMATKPLEAYLY